MWTWDPQLGKGQVARGAHTGRCCGSQRLAAWVLAARADSRSEGTQWLPQPAVRQLGGEEEAVEEKGGHPPSRLRSARTLSLPAAGCPLSQMLVHSPDGAWQLGSLCQTPLSKEWTPTPCLQTWRCRASTALFPRLPLPGRACFPLPLSKAAPICLLPLPVPPGSGDL